MKNQTKINHTQTPWKKQYLGWDNPGSTNPTWEIFADGLRIAHITGSFNNREVNEEMEANAAFIVRAVNSHEALLKAAKAVDQLEIETGGMLGEKIRTALSNLSDAIAQAEKGVSDINSNRE